MPRYPSTVAAMFVAAALLAGHPGFAQGTAGTTAPSDNTTVGAAPQPASSAPASPPGSPSLVTASVRLNGGWRASKFIGSAVYDDQNHKIGDVDDLVLDSQDRAAVAILSVGGFLGIGNKLVAVKFDQLRYDPTAKDAKVVMPGASKESLAALPSFTYAND